MKKDELKEFLDKKVAHYNRPSFIENDPISIPHRFTKKQDIEIAGFFAALFAWGGRKTIINKSLDLMNRFNNAPYDFIQNPSDKDLKRILNFKHRTFMDSDILFLIEFLSQHYKKHDSLESAFLQPPVSMSLSKGASMVRQAQQDNQENRLRNFYNYVFSLDHLKRAEKHISTPAKNSACKRINMYLRWMVRQDNKGVDFGLWKNIKPTELIIPLDVHVCRVAHKLSLLENEKSNWQNAVKLTEQLRLFNEQDPVIYDFALFGMGVAEK